MRSAVAACFVLASVIGLGAARAAECPPDALGVSRTLVVDPSEHPRVGSAQYPESLPLKDHEVVLTFDDGPLPAYTNRILDTLASECVKATFFMVGRMVQAYPATVRRVYNEGHTVANHSLTHPFTFHKMSVDHAAQEIEGGFDALRAALGDPKAVAPFFRFPGLLRQTAVEQYLTAHNVMAWSVDVMADDWTHINNREITRRAISRLEARGKGILLLHDIHAATALALPDILKELKARGFKIVHVVPATPDRPETVAEPELWAARHERGTNVWPRLLPVVGAEPAETALAAPAPASFGIEFVGSAPKVALAQTFERQAASDGEAARPAITPWPGAASYAVPVEGQILPVPAAYNFKYSRPFHLGPTEKPIEKHRVAARRPSRARSTAQHPFGWFFGAPPARQRAYGHQLSVARHPTNLASPQVR
ncbi:MAG TPA: polysaccharide deacetylase family protein [Xanthobacteraceae bacterium]